MSSSTRILVTEPAASPATTSSRHGSPPTPWRPGSWTPSSPGTCPRRSRSRSARPTPLARFVTTDEMASAIAFLASDEAAYITGQILAVGGGLVMM